ncbi:MAG: glycosyltransferase family 2 protein [Oscillospiraceae bacterium]|nr:glycosyltransferase family 2 protein [Oscillospiraceae bacterium]
MAKISVIVPVYKVEPFLRRCVDSILSQTYGDFELILVDDGSPDRCGEICDCYAQQDSRVHVIHQENGGLSAARNTGIDYVSANSDSQWLSFVDSDDWVHPDFLKELLEAAEKNRCLVSACNFYHTTGIPIPKNFERKVRYMQTDDYYCGEFGNAIPAACGKLYNRSLFEKLRYPVGKLHEDEFTTYRALYRAGTVAVVSAGLYAYFQNPNGITRSAWNPRRMDVLEAMEQQIAFARLYKKERMQKKVAEGYLYAVYEQLNQAESAYCSQLRKKLRTAIRLRRECGCPAGYRQIHWAYEAAYPCRILWWLVSKVR